MIEALGIKRNAPRAVRLYKQAASRGDLKAQANLAVMLLEGDGVKRDIAAGLRWLRRAAQRGLPTSCTDTQNTGNIMDRGYDFHAGNGTLGSGTDNGNVFGIINYRDTTRSQAFTYDPLNR